MEFNLMPLMHMLIYVFIVLKTLEFAFPSLFRSIETNSQKTMMMVYGKENDIEKMRKEDRVIDEYVGEDILLMGGKWIELDNDV